MCQGDGSLDTAYRPHGFLIEGETMPRSTRRKSQSGVYHVMVRGINQVQLFYDDADRRAFLERFIRFKDECEFQVYAWCLMGNHVHMLLKEGRVPLSVALKKILLSYSHYYNARYDRLGYLYQDRYKSQPIEDDAYFYAALRYIHRNPLEAGNPLTFWTSYTEYLGEPVIVDVDFALGMLAEDVAKAKRLFAALVEGDGAGLPEYSVMGKPRMRDADAIRIIKEIGQVENCSDLCFLDVSERRERIAEMRHRGLTIRQISRLTGLSRGEVERARPCRVCQGDGSLDTELCRENRPPDTENRPPDTHCTAWRVPPLPCSIQ